MYKARFKKWSSFKYKRESEMRAVARIVKHRASRGKSTKVKIRGQSIDMSDVAHFWKRKNVSIDDVATWNRPSPNPEAVKCFTRISSPMAPLPFLADTEHILTSIQDYIHGSFESGTWVKPVTPTFRCCSTKGRLDAMLLLALLRDNTFLACKLHAKGNFEAAKQIMGAAIMRIMEIARAEDPSTLLILLVLVLHVHRERNLEIALAILEEISTVGREHLGVNHPLCRICNWLASVDRTQVEDIIGRALITMVDHFTDELGPFSALTLYIRMEYIVKIISQSPLEEKSALRKLLYDCEKISAGCDLRTIQLRFALAFHCLRNQEYKEVFRIAQEIARHIKQAENRIPGKPLFRNQRLYISAHCWQAIQESNPFESDPQEADRVGSLLFELEGRFIEWRPED